MSLSMQIMQDRLGRLPKPLEYACLTMDECAQAARDLICASHQSGVWAYVGHHLVEIQKRSYTAVHERANKAEPMPSSFTLRGMMRSMPAPDRYYTFSSEILDQIYGELIQLAAETHEAVYLADHLLAIARARRALSHSKVA
jgi:hypothetical protein